MNDGPGWPYGRLDVAALTTTGWRPTPLREFVLKAHQLCNLACDYCYVYTMADQSWRHRPAVMSPAVWSLTGQRIAEHVRQHRLDEIHVVLHGGEPLLAGRDRLAALLTDLRATVPATCRIRFAVQTNGVLLDEPWIAMLQRYGVRIGVSLDGTADGNDRHRHRLDGRGSYAQVHRALTVLTSSRYRSAFGGLLCTVDPTVDPIACYRSLLGYRPARIDFLLPHANWSQPPPRGPDAGPTPYGDWLVRVFDRWYDAPRQETHVRLFEEILSLVLGGASRSEQVGLSPAPIVVVETDGAIEQVDALKSAYEGAASTGLHVRTDTFDRALTHPGIAARQIGVRALCRTCRQCRIHQICGAGHYAHRYRSGTGFRNPSVYCTDLMRLIDHIDQRVTADRRRLAGV